MNSVFNAPYNKSSSQVMSTVSCYRKSIFSQSFLSGFLLSVEKLHVCFGFALPRFVIG